MRPAVVNLFQFLLAPESSVVDEGVAIVDVDLINLSLVAHPILD